jgi:hypothetical protein
VGGDAVVEVTVPAAEADHAADVLGRGGGPAGIDEEGVGGGGGAVADEAVVDEQRLDVVVRLTPNQPPVSFTTRSSSISAPPA